MQNPIQDALTFLMTTPPTVQRVLAIRTSGDGEFVLKTYDDGCSKKEINLGGKKELGRLITSLQIIHTTPEVPSYETHQSPPDSTEEISAYLAQAGT